MRAWLEETKAALGAAPREVPARLVAVRPDWLPSNDELRLIYEHQQALLAKGRVVWAHLVQANSMAFAAGPDDLPGAAIYSLDPAWDERLPDLAELAADVFELKERHAEREAGLSPEERKIGRRLADELGRDLALPLPASLTEGDSVVMTSVMIMRQSLPGRRLRQSFFPVLALPDLTPAVCLVPHEFWAPELLEAWSH